MTRVRLAAIPAGTADARIADDAGFDFLLLPDDPGGARPEPFTLLAALATVTRRAGLVAGVSTDFNEPYEVARQLASLDHLSDGRAGWLPRWDLFQPGDFRRGTAAQGGADRARGFVAATRTLLDAWHGDDLEAVGAAFVSRADAGAFAYRDEHFDIAGLFNVPRSPQRHPVLFGTGTCEHAEVVLGVATDHRPAYRPLVLTGGEDPAAVADRLTGLVAAGTCAGFVLDPRGGGDLAAFTDRVVPLLARPDPSTTDAGTLRQRLGLPTLPAPELDGAR
jgi:alkanesulfonate monooxygenase SsuD/methylene tetrahydromethanopterin reductase-like flavin-dependent oxidoreductase (luciferase family)